MPRYEYTSILPDGKKKKGEVTAENPFAARKQLRVRGIHVTDVAEITTAAESKNAIFSFFKKRGKSQVVEFTRQLSILLNSGIKLTEALTVLTQQATNPEFKNVLTDIRDRVLTGEALTDALKDYGEYFDVIYVSMVKVGEVTGNLSTSFQTMATFMEKRMRVQSKIVTAMVYPVILIIFCFGAVLFLTIVIVPKIAAEIERTGQKLPMITQMMVGFKNMLLSWKIFIFIGVIVIIVLAVRKFLKTARGAYLRDKLLLSLPLFGPLIKQRVVARFASTLSTLLGSGLSIAESMRVVCEVTGNVLMKKAIQQARERILAGADIATPLRESGVIDPTIAHMVAVGEKSGELEKMLKNISDNLEATTDIVIERLSAAVEPFIIIFVAAMVGLIAYATLLPILEVSSFKFK
jgi:general secretion pathway protein F